MFPGKIMSDNRKAQEFIPEFSMAALISKRWNNTFQGKLKLGTTKKFTSQIMEKLNTETRMHPHQKHLQGWGAPFKHEQT